MKIERMKNVGPNELYGSNYMKFAVLSPSLDGLKQRTPLSTCRDFVCDAYDLTRTKSSAELYGFNWDGKTEKLPWDGLFLLVNFPNKDQFAAFVKNYHILNTIEARNNFVETTVTIFEESREVVVEACPMWLGNMLLLSLYTFLIRVFSHQEFSSDSWEKEMYNDKRHFDRHLIRALDKETFHKVLEDLSQLDSKFWCGLERKNQEDAYPIHHNSGFLSIFGTHPEIDLGTVAKNIHYKEMKAKGFTLHHANEIDRAA